MWSANCAHAAWRVLMDSTADDGTPPLGVCPRGCAVTLATIEPPEVDDLT